MDVGTQFNFRSQAILSGYKQHLRIPVSFLYCWLCEGTQNEARASKLSRKSLRVFTSIIIWLPIEYEIIGEGSQISTNQKPGNSAFSLLIG